MRTGTLNGACAALAALAFAAPIAAAAASPPGPNPFGPSRASPDRVYAVIVGVNGSQDEGVAPLKFADDDAAKYARLFEAVADRIWLLTVLDVDSRTPYADLVRVARIPDQVGLWRTIDEVGYQVAQDRSRGQTTAVYFVYTGHGARAKDGQGYVNLTDARLTRNEFHKLLLEREHSGLWARPDVLHVFIDACSAYFLVSDRGADLTASSEGYEQHLSALFAPRGSDRFPYAGFMLATTGDAKVHEWEAYRGGVFSHLIRSGLTGAADVDLDGAVTYAELGAFVAAASGEIRDPRARINVTVIAPPASPDATLVARDRFKPRQLVLFDEPAEGRYVVEAEGGERIVDLHKPRGQPAIVALWGGRTYYLEGPRGESRLDFRGRTVIAAASLRYDAPRRAERGAVDEEFRRSLFARPYDLSFFRAYCALMRLPPPSDPVLLVIPESLMRESRLSAILPPAAAAPSAAREVTGGRRVSVGGVVSLALAAGLTGTSVALFAASGSASATGDRASAQGLSAAGAGTAIGAGILAVVGVGLLSLDFASGTQTTLLQSGRGGPGSTLSIEF